MLISLSTLAPLHTTIILWATTFTQPRTSAAISKH